jgi:hypothetical protein
MMTWRRVIRSRSDSTTETSASPLVTKISTTSASCATSAGELRKFSSGFGVRFQT